VAIPSIPVFTFRPNWQDGLTESLIWVTDVLASDSGAEQRRSLRLSPARQFELSFALWDRERSFFDLFLDRLGSQECLFPLFHDVGRLVAPAADGDTRLEFDTQYRELTEGGYALIQGKDALTWEAVEIDGIDANGIDLADELVSGWGTGTKVLPLRRGRFDLDDGLSFTKLTSRAASSTFRINLTEPNDWTPAEDSSPVYLGYPVLTLSPDVRDTLDFTFLRNMATLGNDFGKSFYADLSDRAFSTQGHAWYLKGRAGQAAFRDFMYRHRGRAGAFWLPTFNEDMTLAAAAGSTATTFEIEKIGYGYTGGPGPGREYIAIFLRNGTTILRKVTGMLAPSQPSREKVQLNAALGTNIDPATVRSISFVDLARFDQDQFDFQHHTDTDGVTTVSATLRTFSNTRDPSGEIANDIPESEMTSGNCGSPSEDDNGCFPVVCPDYPVVLHFFHTDPCNPSYGASTNLHIPLHGPDQINYPNVVNPPIAEGGPSGVAVSGFNLFGASGTVVESNVYNDPMSGWYHHPWAIHLQGQTLVSWTKANQEFTFYFYFGVAGGWELQIQYPAFYCGSVGKDHGHIEIDMCRTGGTHGECSCPMGMVFESDIAGNVPYTWNWDF
jgi:hypothetical protein